MQQDQLIIYCGCCNRDKLTERPVFITVEDVWYVKWGEKVMDSDEGYVVFVKGYNSEGMLEEYDLDLAYVFYRAGTSARCVGEKLGFECDPCIASFTWDSRFFFKSGAEMKAMEVGEESVKIPFMYSRYVIQNNRREPFRVYVNGRFVGRVSGYGELKTGNILAQSSTSIRAVQDAGYLLVPSEYQTIIEKPLWGEKYVWKFSRY